MKYYKEVKPNGIINIYRIEYGISHTYAWRRSSGVWVYAEEPLPNTHSGGYEITEQEVIDDPNKHEITKEEVVAITLKAIQSPKVDLGLSDDTKEFMDIIKKGTNREETLKQLLDFISKKSRK